MLRRGRLVVGGRASQQPKVSDEEILGYECRQLALGNQRPSSSHARVSVLLPPPPSGSWPVRVPPMQATIRRGASHLNVLCSATQYFEPD